MLKVVDLKKEVFKFCFKELSIYFLEFTTIFWNTAMVCCRNNEWSEGLSLQAGSSTVIRLTSGAQELALIVSVKRLSSTVCQVCILVLS